MQGMDKKYMILEELKKNREGFISGEKLAAHFNISRTAVWKHMEKLRAEGYNLASCTRRGYRYIAAPDVINDYEVLGSLDTDSLGKKVYFFNEVDSTNNIAKRLAATMEGEGMLVIADTQVNGRGRLGREWISPPRSGIWMSVVLKPSISPDEAQLFTIAASVSVASAIEKVTGLRPGIKWPNDVVANGKKVCGILTEMNAETDKVNFVVIGIGINCTQGKDDFPPEIRDKAVSISEALAESGNPKKISRMDVIKETMSGLERHYMMIEDGTAGGCMDEWRRFSLTLGKMITVSHRNGDYNCRAEDIAPDGALIVRLEDGTVKQLFSGEVSIKGVMGHI